MQLSAFLKQAMETCDYPNTDQPFMCLDLTFIYVLLRNGFGLEPSTKLYVSETFLLQNVIFTSRYSKMCLLQLYKKINEHELSWALGAAFNVLQNGL